MLTLATLYILAGGDYISSFFRTSKQTFVTVFIENLEHICNELLVETNSATFMRIEEHTLLKINLNAWIKLICSMYLTKHKTLFNSEPIASLHTSLVTTSLTVDKVQLLKWLAYVKVVPLRNILEWQWRIQRGFIGFH